MNKQTNKQRTTEQVSGASGQMNGRTNNKQTIKESQSTVMPCALKCFDCFVFRHFIRHFSDERLTSEVYPYQSALFLDDVTFFMVGIC